MLAFVSVVIEIIVLYWPRSHQIFVKFINVVSVKTSITIVRCLQHPRSLSRDFILDLHQGNLLSLVSRRVQRVNHVEVSGQHRCQLNILTG